MSVNFRDAVRAILAADSTVPPSLAAAALKLLAGNEPEAAPLPRLIRTSEAARLFGVTPKALRDWGDKGVLEPVYAGQTACRIGYTEASVKALLEGRGGKPDTNAANARAARMREASTARRA